MHGIKIYTGNNMFAPNCFMWNLFVVCLINSIAITKGDILEANALTSESTYFFDEHILEAIVEQTRLATISPECAKDLNVTYNGIHERQPWAIASEFCNSILNSFLYSTYISLDVVGADIDAMLE